MRHRVSSHQFGRSTKPRQALLKGLVRSLLERGSITTSKDKAKETRRIADKLISKAQTDSVAVRRQLHRFFGKRDVVNTLVERVAPAMKDRKSGFTKTMLVGKRRGDNAEMVKLELMSLPEQMGSFKNPAPKNFAPKPAPKKAASTKAEGKKAAGSQLKKAVKKTVNKSEK